MTKHTLFSGQTNSKRLKPVFSLIAGHQSAIRGGPIMTQDILLAGEVLLALKVQQMAYLVCKGTNKILKSLDLLL